jgi:hypothetical protein
MVGDGTAVKRWILLSAFSLGIGGAAWCQEEAPELPRVTLEGDAEYLRSSGWLFITRGSEPGSATRIHERREFGLDSEGVPAFGATARIFEAHALGVRLESIDQKGTRSSPDDFVYHGTLYPAGREISAEAGFLLAGVDYQYLWRPNEVLGITPHLGFEYWGFSSRLRTVDPGPSIDEKRSFSSGYWLSGVDVGARLDPRVELRLSLLGGVNGADRNFLDVRGGFWIRVVPAVSLSAGYLLQEVRFHTSTNRADLLYYGPSAGLEISF